MNKMGCRVERLVNSFNGSNRMNCLGCGGYPDPPYHSIIYKLTMGTIGVFHCRRHKNQTLRELANFSKSKNTQVRDFKPWQPE